MKQYVERRLPDVKAIQWFKHGDVPGLAVDPNNLDNAILNPDDLWDDEILRPGDYYCVHCGGLVFRLPQDKFERIYREYVE